MTVQRQRYWTYYSSSSKSSDRTFGHTSDLLVGNDPHLPYGKQKGLNLFSGPIYNPIGLKHSWYSIPRESTTYVSLMIPCSINSESVLHVIKL